MTILLANTGAARVTSTGEFIPQLDGLRFLSVALIFIHHVFAFYLVQTHRLGAQELPRDWGLIYNRSPLVPWALDLVFGIPIFCVISGFILSVPFARNAFKGAAPPSRKRYFLRRLIRIAPPYAVSMIAIFLTIVIPWRQAHPADYFRSYFHAFFPHLLASLAYLHAAIYGYASWINGVAWTLEIEIQFYVLLPLLALLFQIRPAAWRRSLLLAAIFLSALFAQRVVGDPGHSRLSLSLPLQLHFFLAGMLLTDLYVEPPRWLRLSPRAADLLAIASAALLVIVIHRATRFACTQPFLLLGFFRGVFTGKWISRIFRLRAITLFGGMGYTTYLYHVFILDHLLPFSVRLFPPAHALWLDTAVQIVLVSPPVLAICALLFFAIERPFMVLSRNAARRLRASR